MRELLLSSWLFSSFNKVLEDQSEIGNYTDIFRIWLK